MIETESGSPMNKGRVEAFTDAVIAIVMTIMVLEFKIPDQPTFKAMAENSSYLAAYLISFLFIGVAWYNHHYMLTLTKHVTKRIYWLNNLWLLSMSVLPVATAWAGKFITKPQPELFYFIIFLLWALAYIALSHAIIVANQADHPEVSAKIRRMVVYRLHTSWWFWLLSVGLAAMIVFVWPPLSLVFTVIELILMAVLTTADSDRVAWVYWKITKGLPNLDCESVLS